MIIKALRVRYIVKLDLSLQLLSVVSEWSRGLDAGL